jgi:redox-sensitive bicupin YhaK (pirin superfamily)
MSLALLRPHVRDLGEFSVRRVLPGHPRKMVGPFIFFDHMGPARFPPGAGIDVRPHPHIGLATVTYLYEGAILHRDSLGVVQRIEPGDVNWMTAGEGIVHSERTPPELRASGSPVHGIQTWVALPKSHECVAPAFEHHPKASLPVLESPGVHLRLIAGRGFGLTAPTTTYSPMVYAAVEMAAGATLTFPAEHEERALYVARGDVSLGGDAVPEAHLAPLDAGTLPILEARSPATLMLLGGAPMDGDRHIWWNFVASERTLIEAAKLRWRDGGFPAVPGETEFIPLPER